MTSLKVWVQNIQNKTEKQKKIFAFALSLGITAGIAFIWMLNFLTVGPISNKIVQTNSSSKNKAVIVESAKEFFKSVTRFGKEEYRLE